MFSRSKTLDFICWVVDESGLGFVYKMGKGGKYKKIIELTSVTKLKNLKRTKYIMITRPNTGGWKKKNNETETLQSGEDYQIQIQIKIQIKIQED